jgi:hypothetical protein
MKAWLSEVESRDTIFQEIDYRVYALAWVIGQSPLLDLDAR